MILISVEIAFFRLIFGKLLKRLSDFIYGLIWGIYARFYKKKAKSFQLILSLTNHREKSHGCKYCTKVFLVPSQLQAHIAQSHVKGWLISESILIPVKGQIKSESIYEIVN